MSASMMRKPRSDDRLICDLTDGVTGCFAVGIAHEVGVFRSLARGSRTASELAAALDLVPRAVETLLIICVAAGLLRSENGRYSLMPVAEDYLLDSSPTYMGALFGLWSDEDEPFSYRALRAAVIDARAYEEGRRSWIDAHRRDLPRAAAFTRVMHGHSTAPALAWPEHVDLSGHARMLDVGGGSGVHAIGARMRWPQLEAVVLDIPPVCIAAREYIERFGMTDHVTTCAADMWADAWPDADLHFFSDVFHDWTPEECRVLARRSHERLPANGRIIVHEMLLDDEKRGPFAVASSSLSMLAWCGGQQFSARELSALLRECGFADVQCTPTFGYWSIVTGVKR